MVAAIWFGSSFWGALDTAFCRIYHCECRTWVRQKLFALGMFAVVLLFVVASVAVPFLQALLIATADDLPLGLSDVDGLVYGVTLAARRARAVRDAVRDLPAGAARPDAVARGLAGRARRRRSRWRSSTSASRSTSTT